MARTHYSQIKKLATHCQHGHRFDVANTYIKPSGHRRCEQCAARRNRRFELTSRDFIRAAKDIPCCDCGKQYPPCVMDFDHTGEKSFNFGKEGHRHSIDELIEEIVKCDVVCSNCHRVRTWNRMHPSEQISVGVPNV